MNFKYDKMYIRPYGSSAGFEELPYEIEGVNTLPEHDVSANDVDLDAFTNTEGYTVRNRVRHDVASVTFSVPTMTGKELHKFFNETTNVWLECVFFYEPEWGFTHKKMYRSATVSYHKYYVDPVDPEKNIYQDVSFSFVEQ